MKKMFVVLAAVALVAAACNSKTQTTTQTQTQTPPAKQSTSMSLSDLLAGGSQMCTFVDGQASGTTYVANGKSRSDVSTTVNGKTTVAHTIIADKTSYTWVDGQSQGFKMSLAATANTSNSTSTNSNSSQGQVDPNKKLDYKCSAWAGDNSKFVIPTDMEFMDMSSIKLPTGNMPINGGTIPQTGYPNKY